MPEINSLLIAMLLLANNHPEPPTPEWWTPYVIPAVGLIGVIIGAGITGLFNRWLKSVDYTHNFHKLIIEKRFEAHKSFLEALSPLMREKGNEIATYPHYFDLNEEEHRALIEGLFAAYQENNMWLSKTTDENARLLLTYLRKLEESYFLSSKTTETNPEIVALGIRVVPSLKYLINKLRIGMMKDFPHLDQVKPFLLELDEVVKRDELENISPNKRPKANEDDDQHQGDD